MFVTFITTTVYIKKLAKGKIYAPLRVKFLGLKLRFCKKRDKYQVCRGKPKEWAFEEAFLNCFVIPVQYICGSVWVSFVWMALVGMVVAWPCLTQHSPFVLSWRCLCRKSIQAEGKLKVQHCDSADDSKIRVKRSCYRGIAEGHWTIQFTVISPRHWPLPFQLNRSQNLVISSFGAIYSFSVD